MKNDLISIIVPIYNSEKYLKDLFESIDNQKYKNYELILLDDGSTDNSKKTCKDYVKKNKNAKYYHKDNSGVSDTRNQGIRMAKGNYICFIDSDDIISENYLSNFIEELDKESNTMLCCRCKKFKNKKEIKPEIKNKAVLKEYVNKNKYDLIFTEYAGYSVNKLFKRETIIKNSIFFNSEIGMCEDLLFVFEYLKYVDKVHCLSNTNYYYREVEQSASKSLKNLKWFSIFKTYNKLKEELNLCSPFFINKYYYMYNFYILFAKFRLRYIKRDIEYNKIKKIIESNKKIIKNKYKCFTIRQKIKLFIFKYFNFIAFTLKLAKEK